MEWSDWEGTGGGDERGSGGRADARERHKLAERERRKSMRELFLSLHAQLPHGQTVRKAQSAILDEIIDYIPLAAARLRTLQARRDLARSSSSRLSPPSMQVADRNASALNFDIHVMSDSTSSVVVQVRGNSVNVSLTDTRAAAQTTMLSSILDELESHHLKFVQSTHCRYSSKLLHHSECKEKMVAACLFHQAIRLTVPLETEQPRRGGRSSGRGPANGGMDTATTSGRARAMAMALKCSLRDKGLSKKPLWRTKEDMSLEAKQASVSLRMAKGEEAIARVMTSTVSRLLKPDLLALLAHLQRTDCCDLAIKLFDYARKEIWYRPEASFYFDMIYMLGRNRLMEKAEYYFLQLQEEGLQPETRLYTEMLAVYMQVGMVDKAMNMYRMMKEAGCEPSTLTFTILLRNLQRFSELDSIKEVESDAIKYLEEGEEFLRNVRMRRTNA